jgi:hypothetical protein
LWTRRQYAFSRLLREGSETRGELRRKAYVSEDFLLSVELIPLDTSYLTKDALAGSSVLRGSIINRWISPELPHFLWLFVFCYTIEE